ncbi:hypothetical protein ACC680_29050, partial [Rhizobium ruizarguesonis]
AQSFKSEAHHANPALQVPRQRLRSITHVSAPLAGKLIRDISAMEITFAFYEQAVFMFLITY